MRGGVNAFLKKGFPAKLCPIFALSAKLCRVNTAIGELECSCLSAKICRFWWPIYAVSDTFPQARLVLLVECGTHLICDAEISSCRQGETTGTRLLLERWTL